MLFYPTSSASVIYTGKTPIVLSSWHQLFSVKVKMMVLKTKGVNLCETETILDWYECVIFVAIYMRVGQNDWSIFTWDQYKLKKRRFLELYNFHKSII